MNLYLGLWLKPFRYSLYGRFWP